MTKKKIHFFKIAKKILKRGYPTNQKSQKSAHREANKKQIKNSENETSKRLRKSRSAKTARS